VRPALLEERLKALKEVSAIEDLFAIAGIGYCAPRDCAHSTFASHSFDIHFSYTVLEHIPGPTLEAILLEANRLLKPCGVILHHIDLSDHFEQVDRSITKVNFLRLTEADWSRYSGTPWSYHNQLRRDEYREIFGSRRKILSTGMTLWTSARSNVCAMVFP
jgi:SAM-dependent methyltransferase